MIRKQNKMTADTMSINIRFLNKTSEITKKELLHNSQELF